MYTIIVQLLMYTFIMPTFFTFGSEFAEPPSLRRSKVRFAPILFLQKKSSARFLAPPLPHKAFRLSGGPAFFAKFAFPISSHQKNYPTASLLLLFPTKPSGFPGAPIFCKVRFPPFLLTKKIIRPLPCSSSSHKCGVSIFAAHATSHTKVAVSPKL